jgi:hypothetical protein
VKEVNVMKRIRSMRKAVLSRMFDVLERTYGITVRREEFIGGSLSPHEIEGILSFKSDPRLDELHDALHRIEEGTYGVCIGCKHDIGQPILKEDPTRRMCNVCEQEYSKPVMHLHSALLHS